MTESIIWRRLVALMCCVLGSAFLSGACVSSPPPAPSSLCALVKDFGTYQGKLVVLRASVLSDAHHQASLQDASCPRNGAVLSYSDMGVRNGSANRLREAVFANPPGTLEKSVSITTTGRLTRESADEGGLFVFMADSIGDIRIMSKVTERR